MGSLMSPYGGDGPATRKYATAKCPEEVKEEAVRFLQEFYSASKR